jgi:hypothetical protein
VHPPTAKHDDKEESQDSETEAMSVSVESIDSEVAPGDATPEAQKDQLQQQVEIQEAAALAEAEAEAAAAAREETQALRAQQIAAAERMEQNRIKWHDFIETVRHSMAQLQSQDSNFRIES